MLFSESENLKAPRYLQQYSQSFPSILWLLFSDGYLVVLLKVNSTRLHQMLYF